MFQLQLAAAALNCKGGNPACASTYAGAQKNMDSGYPLDWFTGKVDEKLICEICGKVLQSPRATPCCSNKFCLHCLEFWIEYYGVCPKRCGEIEADGLVKDQAIEKCIQSLSVHCKHGCKAKITLEDKLKHEKKCTHKQEENGITDTTENDTRRSSTQSQDTYVEMASVACRNRTGVESSSSESTNRVNLHPIFSQDLAYYTYNLTRRRQGESLGFVLVAGAKNSNGKAVNFSIKSVNPNTVAAEAGLLPGDRIVQVDNIPLSQLAQSEAITKIKDNPYVILTVIRTNPMKQALKTSRRSIEDHVYEDIVNSEEPTDPQVLLQAEKFRERLNGYNYEEEASNNYPKHRRTSDSRSLNPRHLSPPVQLEQPIRSSNSTSRLLTDKMSKDSGLSSGGSSSASHHHFNRQMMSSVEHIEQHGSKHSYRSEREAMKKSMLERDIVEPVEPQPRPRHCYEDYEIEEIYLQKNGTNQLGITLGYDTKSSSGNLMVCEIVSEGLAAQDGRLKKGDVIQKSGRMFVNQFLYHDSRFSYNVNGFEVYDPEEAILLFLEQDQDITLTVARKPKTRRRRHNMMSSRSQSSLNTINDASELRRTDSCGSLDSITHRDPTDSALPTTPRRHSASSRHTHKILVDNGRTFHAPTVSSSGYTTGPDSITMSTDFVFRPINDSRPATAGEIIQSTHNRYLRSTTSLGSDPERSNGYHQQFQNPVSRHRSFESSDHRRLRSPTPLVNNRGFGYRAPSPLKNSSRSFFSDNPRMTDQVVPVMMQRSVSTFRCESLV